MRTLFSARMIPTKFNIFFPDSDLSEEALAAELRNLLESQMKTLGSYNAIESGSVKNIKIVEVTWEDLYPSTIQRLYARSIASILRKFNVRAQDIGQASILKRLALFKDRWVLEDTESDTPEIKVYHEFVYPSKYVSVDITLIPIVPVEHITMSLSIGDQVKSDE